MTRWQCRAVPFKYQLSDITLLSLPIPLQVRAEKLADDTPPAEQLAVPQEPLESASQGYFVRGLPIASEQEAINQAGGYLLCYVPKQYQHCYIDLTWTFEEYQAKFSSKTRSTINRKIKKFAENCGGELKWKTYKSPGEIAEYIGLARAVSKLTYQERLLDAGLPESEEFIRNAMRWRPKGASAPASCFTATGRSRICTAPSATGFSRTRMWDTILSTWTNRSAWCSCGWR